MILRTGTRKNIEYDFWPHREYLVAVFHKENRFSKLAPLLQVLYVIVVLSDLSVCLLVEWMAYLKKNIGLIEAIYSTCIVVFHLNALTWFGWWTIIQSTLTKVLWLHWDLELLQVRGSNGGWFNRKCSRPSTRPVLLL